ncbi:MAG: CDP-glycerol glycerophosphotransferase family protein [Bacteroidales bacterium]|nr:CDP-glycerol glycerophosphotransferase family protein [Bacteroidales bacterium]
MKSLFRKIYLAIRTVFGFLCRLFFPIRKGTILCWSYSGSRYACNPRYITEYIIDNSNRYTLYYSMQQQSCRAKIPDRVKICRHGSLRFIFLLNTVEFIITNARLQSVEILSWRKRTGQKYVQTWHASIDIKKIEADAQDVLSKRYVLRAHEDSNRCDLMLSGCDFHSQVIRKAFWYDGEILEKGTPRNDILFDALHSAELRKKITRRYGIPAGSKILLYAPTFRADHNMQYYRLEWPKIIEVLKRRFKSDIRVLLRLHPNMMSRVEDVSQLINSPYVSNATYYDDMQELLAASDILLTDYSSSVFDMALTRKPCFIYAPDYATYDRGTYMPLNTLPFPFSQTEDDLLAAIEAFDIDTYCATLSHFLDNTLHAFEQGHACQALFEWVESHSV